MKDGSPARQPTIRIASRADAEIVTSIINRAFKDVEGLFIENDRIDEEEVFRLLGKGKFLLATVEKLVLGCVYIEVRVGGPGAKPRSYLGLLAVDPNQQRNGLGSLLMQAAEDYCRELGSAFMDISVVNLRKELPGYYHRRGYVETGTAPFPADIKTKQPVHFIVMTKRLG